MNIERETLIAVLEQVAPAIASSGAIQEFKYVWLDGKYLYAFNGSLGIRIAWTSELHPCGLPGVTLLGLLKSSSAKEVTLKQEGSPITQLNVKMGRSSTTVPLFNIESNPWPFPAKLAPNGKLTLELTEGFVTGLRRARAIKASKPVRVEHYGISLFPSGGDSIALYSTDSKSLVEAVVQGKYAKELKKTVLPHAFVTELLTLKAPAKVQVVTDGNGMPQCLAAEAEGIQVCSNLLDSDSVWDLPTLTDETIGNQDVVETKLPTELGEALNRADVLAGSEPGYVQLRIANKELELSGDLPNGLFKEKFPLATKAASGEIKVELDTLRKLYKGADTFAIAPKALILFGINSLFLIAAHEGKK